jgi:hypothetical protein
MIHLQQQVLIGCSRAQRDLLCHSSLNTGTVCARMRVHASVSSTEGDILSNTVDFQLLTRIACRAFLLSYSAALYHSSG